MFTWIHTCPQREEEAFKTSLSVKASDIRDFEVWRHSKLLTTGEQIEAWWEGMLIRASQKSDFFLRLEDDVVVCKTIQTRILDWGALKEPDFGVGILYRWEGSPDHPGCVDRTGAFPKITDYFHMAAPGIVFRSEKVSEILDQIHQIRGTREFSRSGLLNLDTVVGQACRRLGLSVYLHEPSLVDCREAVSANQPGALALCRAKDFQET
jgi:hypothetical protein